MFTTLLFFNPLDNWMAYLSPNIQKNSEIAIKICKPWLLPAWLRKKNTFWRKKALKNTFPQQKNTMMKKKHKETLLFFKNTCSCWVCTENSLSKSIFQGGSEGWASTQQQAGRVWFLNWSEMVECLKHIFTTLHLCPSLRPCQPSDIDAIQHFSIPLHPPS